MYILTNNRYKYILKSLLTCKLYINMYEVHKSTCALNKLYIVHKATR